MRPILTIFCLLVFYNAFAQSDSFLQSFIDSAKAGVHHGSAKDSQKVVNIPSLKKDSSRVIKKDSLKKSVTVPDSVLSANRQPFKNTLSDSLKNDSISTTLDTVATASFKKLTWENDTAFVHLLSLPVAKTNTLSIKDGDVHLREQKDYLFYLLVAIVLLLAIIKQLFPKYYQNIFQLMFQASFRQKQTREQMMQQGLPSLFMNILFVLVGGLFIALLANINKWLNISFWILTMYSITLLALIYTSKYVVIKFMGWVFNAQEQASTYGFIVFLVNKAIGLSLLPLLLLLAFSGPGSFQQVTITIAFCVVILLLILRYIVSLTIIRNTLSVHPLHFFIYLCAVELMPMLILYKVLFSFVGKRY